MMIQAFDLLLNYAITVLMPNRPYNWHTIDFANTQFKAHCDCMIGARDILKLLGFTAPKYGDDGVTQTGLIYPDPTEINYIQATMIAAELLIAKSEVNLIIEGIILNDGSY